MLNTNRTNFLGIDFERPLQSKSPFTNIILLILWLAFSYIATKLARYFDEKFLKPK